MFEPIWRFTIHIPGRRNVYNLKCHRRRSGLMIGSSSICHMVPDSVPHRILFFLMKTVNRCLLFDERVCSNRDLAALYNSSSCHRNICVHVCFVVVKKILFLRIFCTVIFQETLTSLLLLTINFKSQLLIVGSQV